MQLAGHFRVVQFACIAVLLFRSLGEATEKFAIAQNADLVVVGHMAGIRSSLEPDGWMFTGTIVANEVVFGRNSGQRRYFYRFLCSCCPKFPRPEITSFRAEGMWFLRSFKANMWQSAGACADPGFRSKADLPEMRRFLKGRHEL